MSHLSAFLPAVDGVAVYASLHRAAAAGHAAGDPRTKGQLMADTLITRVTGHQPCTQPIPDAAAHSAPTHPDGHRDPPPPPAPRPTEPADTQPDTSADRPHTEDDDNDDRGGSDSSDGEDRNEAADHIDVDAADDADMDGTVSGDDDHRVDVPDDDATRDRDTDTADNTKTAGTDAGPGARAAPTGPSRQPVMIHLLVSDAILLGGRPGTAHLDGYGPIPADLARDLATQAGIDGRAWLRRVYTTPASGDLVATDSHARIFPTGLAQLVRLRDGVCRTTWCDAPIAETDHPRSVQEGGPTSLTNSQGLCTACNRAKQAPGWRARPAPGTPHTVSTTTPTGHTYQYRAPAAEHPLAS